MKNQAFFSSKDKSEKIKMSSAAIFVWRFKGYYDVSKQALTSLNGFIPEVILMLLLLFNCENTRLHSFQKYSLTKCTSPN